MVLNLQWKQCLQVGVEGLQIKPQAEILQDGLLPGRPTEAIGLYGGINLETSIVISKDDDDIETVKWVVENLKFSVKKPVTSNCKYLIDFSYNYL